MQGAAEGAGRGLGCRVGLRMQGEGVGHGQLGWGQGKWYGYRVGGDGGVMTRERTARPSGTLCIAMATARGSPEVTEW